MPEDHRPKSEAAKRRPKRPNKNLEEFKASVSEALGSLYRARKKYIAQRGEIERRLNYPELYYSDLGEKALGRKTKELKRKHNAVSRREQGNDDRIRKYEQLVASTITSPDELLRISDRAKAKAAAPTRLRHSTDRSAPAAADSEAGQTSSSQHKEEPDVSGDLDSKKHAGGRPPKDPRVFNLVIQLRTTGKKKSWLEIANKVNSELKLDENKKMTPGACRSLYDRFRKGKRKIPKTPVEPPIGNSARNSSEKRTKPAQN